MFKRTIFSVIVLSFFLASPAYSAKTPGVTACKIDAVAGSYVRVSQSQSVGFDGTIIDRTYLFQLKLSSDGIAVQNFTGADDMFDIYGGESDGVGSWECRKDGKLLVTMFSGSYRPVVDGLDPFTGESVQASELRFHYLVSYLLSVTSADTLKTVETGVKEFNMSEVPTDPNAGSLVTLHTLEREYNRVKPIDEFLTQ